MRLRTAVALVIAVGVVPMTAFGQSAQQWSVQVSALSATLQGDAFTGWGSGVGVEAQARYTTRTGFSYGAGYQFTSHTVKGDSKDATLQGPFFEPRYTFVLGDNEAFFPYVSGRFSILQEQRTLQGLTATTSGETGNAGGGVLIRLGSSMNLDLGATFGLTNFGDVTFASGGQSLTGSKGGSGTNVILRAGLSFGLK